MAEAKLRYGVVTGANKGIGFETVKELASNGVKVVLTARDEKRGLEAIERLKESGLSDLVIFHQLDVTDSASIASLVDFVKNQFGKLDILVNNAGITGVNLDEYEMGSTINWKELGQTCEMAEKCLTTNYYGAKKTTEAFLPLLQLSNSPRIVNVSSQSGLLKNIANEWAKGVLDDAENLTEERIDEVLKEFIKDFKEGSLENKGWPTFVSAYVVSKAAMNSYTRIIAKKQPNMCINSVCPGFVKTDINRNTGILSVDQGAASVVRLALLPHGSPSGLFYIRQELSSFSTHPRKRTLELTISSLDELREDWKPALKNLYVAVRADSITSYATGTAEDCGGNSSWNETLVVEVPAHARSVTLEVKCRNSPGVKDVGVARIAVTDFLSGAAAGSDECERKKAKVGALLIYKKGSSLLLIDATLSLKTAISYHLPSCCIMGEEAKRYAVVTGANKGIGFGMCEKLASSGIVVVLTARDEKRGLKAVEKLKEFGLSDFIVFHQLDVNDPASVATLADFIKTQFGKLDILVNNAAVTGGKLLDGDALLRKRNGEQIDWSEVGYQTYELAEQCVETNFYGVERVTEALVPLLQLSISPRIINISSRAGLLKNIPNEWARRMFSDIENLTREKIDGVLKEFQKDFKEGSLENKGWPAFASAYTMSKAALNAYTRVMAKKYPHFHINSVCPGFVKTDMNNNTGQLSIDEGTQTPLMLALMPNSVPSGCFFNQGEVIPF
ncbi:uncharacterized protein LOC109801817 [Cajanus cajan]|uniref:uncharacterized protein LOC109801817 n=1 Tax=Cajanus cajan TaxID=3821 RepID=UPI0010FAE7AB|nr:uncharacterized protein LOC109801817 [Cajanus cajan]